MNITINEREKNTLEKTIEILNRYSAMYSALVKGCTGMHNNNAATAAGLLNAIINDSYKTEVENNV